jgi:formamidopyrimidine-DNA glycosylase
MPELPEVEIMTRNIRKWFEKSTIRIDILDERWLRQGGIDTIQCQMVQGVTRRAKYTLIHFEKEILILHFRMTGKVVPNEPGRKKRVLFYCANQDEMNVYAFVDPRCLGEGKVISKNDLSRFFSHLGPEPWPKKLSGSFLQNCFSSKGKSPIKNAMLQQEIVSGVGNILACESLYKAQISPCKKVSDVSVDEWSLWSDKIIETIDLIIEKESFDEIVYVNEGGDNIFDVYARENEICSKCLDTIKRIKQAGRSTFFCPTCQKMSGT